MTTMFRAGVAGAVAVAIAGCGGGGLDKAELAKKADAICKKYSEQTTKLGTPDVSDPKVAEEYYGKAGALATKQQDELEALEPADDARKTYARFTKATAGATDLLTALAAAAKDGDTQKGGELLNDLTPVVTEVSEAGTALGAKNCAG